MKCEEIRGVGVKLRRASIAAVLGSTARFPVRSKNWQMSSSDPLPRFRRLKLYVMGVVDPAFLHWVSVARSSAEASLA